MAARWYHLQGAEQVGPLGLDAVRERVLDGTVHPDTYVWCEGMDDWMRARDVPALVPPPDIAHRPPGWPTTS